MLGIALLFFALGLGAIWTGLTFYRRSGASAAFFTKMLDRVATKRGIPAPNMPLSSPPALRIRGIVLMVIGALSTLLGILVIVPSNGS